MSRRHLLRAFVLACAAACDPVPAPGETATTDGPGPVALEPVVANRLAELDARLADADAPPDPSDVDPEHVRGLATMLGNGGEMRELALEEARGLGEGAVPELSLLARDETASDAERSAAIEILGALDTFHAAKVLLELLESGEPAWVRAHAAWRLGDTTQDWVVPRTLLRLKYEKDHETVVWMARLLAGFGNFSGVPGLVAIAADEASPQREAARASLGKILADVGLETLEELQSAWVGGDPDATLPPHDHSPRFDREVWRWVDRLREWQLRGVDDARFVIERCSSHAAEMIAPALHDENLYTRVHLAQSLERMGPHAAPAGPALIAALDDPDLAPNACAALGGIRYAPGGPALVARLDPAFDLDVRLAAARALGRMGDAAPDDAPAALRATFAADTLLEIRQAAAESLLFLGEGEAQLPFVIELLTGARVDTASTQAALRHWLVRRSEAGVPGADELLARWDELGVPADRIVPVEERRDARRARQALLTEALEL